MPKYYIGNVFFCDCAENSLKDITIRAMQKEDEKAKLSKRYPGLFSSKPGRITAQKSKNILSVVRDYEKSI